MQVRTRHGAEGRRDRVGTLGADLCAPVLVPAGGHAGGCDAAARLGADVAGGGPGARAEYGSRLVVDGIAIGCAPEEVLLKGQDQTADRGHGEAPAGTDDVLPPDVVDVAEVRVAIRKELIEGADVPARAFVSARIVELEVDAGRQTRDRQRVAEHAGEHPSGDVPAPHRPELACSLDLEVQVGLADLAPGPASQRLAVLAPGGAVE